MKRHLSRETVGTAVVSAALGACLIEIHELVPSGEGGGTVATTTTSAGGGGGSEPGGGGAGGAGGGVVARGAYWRFDEAEGQVAQDDVGYANDIVLGDTSQDETAAGFEPTWVEAPNETCSGAALDFDGALSIATVESNDNLADHRRFSTSFCINPRSLDGFGRIISREYQATDGLYVTVTQTGAINAAHYDTRGTAYQSSSTAGLVSVGTVSCFTVTFDDMGDRAFHIFQGGVEVTDFSLALPDGALLRGGTTGWRIGNNGAKTRGFDGIIDEVYVDDTIVDAATMIARERTCK